MNLNDFINLSPNKRCLISNDEIRETEVNDIDNIKIIIDHILNKLTLDFKLDIEFESTIKGKDNHYGDGLVYKIKIKNDYSERRGIYFINNVRKYDKRVLIGNVYITDLNKYESYIDEYMRDEGNFIINSIFSYTRLPRTKTILLQLHALISRLSDTIIMQEIDLTSELNIDGFFNYLRDGEFINELN